MQSYVFPDVHVYESRNSYWPGQILKTVSGADLYLTSHTTRPWGFIIHCDAAGKPHSVEFENGRVWSFCYLSDRMLNIEWPLFVKDYEKGDWSARVERIFTDSMHLTIVSKEALLNDILVWRYPPRGGRNGVSIPQLSPEMPVCV